MAHLLSRLIKSYKRHGFEIRGGVNPYSFNDPYSSFMLICQDGVPLNTGGGLSPMEIFIMEQILTSLKNIRNILIIGNAFGWSTLAIAMICPSARVIAIDADIEGIYVKKGGELTEEIAKEERLNIQVVKAISPRDIPFVIQHYMDNAPLDFVLIDGLHVDEQLLLDFQAVSMHASEHCIFALHDILNWHMLSALGKISEQAGHTGSILTRSPSGMAVVYKNIPSQTIDIINSYVDETVNITEWIKSNIGSNSEPGPILQGRLSKGYPTRLFGLAEVYVAEDDWVKVSETLTRVVRDNPSNADTAFNAGAFLFDRGRPLD